MPWDRSTQGSSVMWIHPIRCAPMLGFTDARSEDGRPTYTRAIGLLRPSDCLHVTLYDRPVGAREGG